MLSLWLNPNNHALDGGKASSQMEKEAVADLARMLGIHAAPGTPDGRGHYGEYGGTMGRASCLGPGKRILASDQAHYTHSRLCEVLGVPFHCSFESDGKCRMDMDALRERADQGGCGDRGRHPRDHRELVPLDPFPRGPGPAVVSIDFSSAL